MGGVILLLSPNRRYVPNLAALTCAASAKDMRGHARRKDSARPARWDGGTATPKAAESHARDMRAPLLWGQATKTKQIRHMLTKYKGGTAFGHARLRRQSNSMPQTSPIPRVPLTHKSFCYSQMTPRRCRRCRANLMNKPPLTC